MAARIAVVTGGTGGLGETISTKLHDKGYTVVVTHSPGNNAITDLLAGYKSKGYNFRAYGVDVADLTPVRRAWPKYVRRWALSIS